MKNDEYVDYIATNVKYELVEMCKQHNWFTGGSTEAYEKMLSTAAVHTAHETALMIWMVSPDSDKNEIQREVTKILQRVKIKAAKLRRDH